MKKEIEERADAAVKMLMQTLTRNHEDIGVIIDEYEKTHDDYEMYKSKDYQALCAGYFAMQKGIEKINRIINKD